MSLVLNTTHHNPRSRAKNVGNPDISAKGSENQSEFIKLCASANAYQRRQIGLLVDWYSNGCPAESDPRRHWPIEVQAELRAAGRM